MNKQTTLFEMPISDLLRGWRSSRHSLEALLAQRKDLTEQIHDERLVLRQFEDAIDQHHGESDT